jgi:uncharacterized membrane protein
MNPFEWRTVLLAKHAKHVVLIHFPTALFIIAVAFDLLAYWRRRQEYAAVAYYNLAATATFVVPTVLTGLLAKEFLIQHHKVKELLLYHLLAALASATVVLLR